MTVSCACGDGDFDWYYTARNDFVPLVTQRRKRCVSCKELIDRGSAALQLWRWREPRTEIEERIYGEGGEIPLASWYLCEECGGLYMSIIELGYCVVMDDNVNMRELARQTGQGLDE